MEGGTVNRSRVHPQANNCQLPPLGMERARYLRENTQFRRESQTLLEKWKIDSSGGRCFILANGPSIGDLDISKLQNEVCFGVNATYRLFKDFDWFPEYYVVTQRARLLDELEVFESIAQRTRFAYCDDLEYPSPHTFFRSLSPRSVLLLNQRLSVPAWVVKYLFLRNRIGYFFNHRFRSAQISEDLNKGVCIGKSVVFTCLQLARHLGFDEIYLLGVDMNYSGPKTHFFGNANWVPDQNYELEVAPFFRSFAKSLNRDGIKVYNCSMQSAVSDFEKLEFEKVLGDR